MNSSIPNISLYIPHIFSNYNKKDIEDIFENLKIGKINNIDLISKIGKDNKEYNSAYIHFEYWYNNQITQNLQERVLNPNKEARLVYEDPWYWIVLENKGKKIQTGSRKTCIDLGGLNAISTKNDCPNKPIKLAKTIQNNETLIPSNLINDFNKSEDFNVEIAMKECQDLMEDDDKYLAYFDKRYVNSIEQENQLLRTQIYQLHNAYYNELMKSSALGDSINKK